MTKKTKKPEIVITFSAYGKKLEMRYPKDILLLDYEQYCLNHKIANTQPKSIRYLIKDKLAELFSELINSEHSYGAFRY